MRETIQWQGCGALPLSEAEEEQPVYPDRLGTPAVTTFSTAFYHRVTTQSLWPASDPARLLYSRLTKEPGTNSSVRPSMPCSAVQCSAAAHMQCMTDASLLSLGEGETGTMVCWQLFPSMKWATASGSQCQRFSTANHHNA